MKKLFKRIILILGYKLIAVNKNFPAKKESETAYDVLNGTTEPPFNSVPYAGETLQHFLNSFEFNTVLDIGSGEGKHSDVLRDNGKDVTSIDFGKSIYFQKRAENHTCIFGDYYTYDFKEQFDAIWASHVLEHQPNPNFFLKKIHKDLKENGVLAITVPPLKHNIVGGHVTLWNAGLLLYQLVLAGFNCKDVSIKSYGYNISVVLRKRNIVKYPELSYDSGDIIKLKEFFPDFVDEPFLGDIPYYNWK